MNQNRIFIFLQTLVGFLFLISGNLFYIEDDYFKLLVQMPSSVFVILFILKNINSTRVERAHLFYFVVGIILLLLSTLKSFFIEYAFFKIDSIIFNCFFAFLYFNIIIEKNGLEIFLKNILYVGLILLIPTFFYKIYFGFFQRDVRFFLNGANVFGWLCGFYALISLIFIKKKIYYFFYGIFALCVIWAQSKGALVSLFISTVLIFALNSNNKSLKILAVIPIFYIIRYIIISFFPESRINAIFRVLEGQTDDSDYGSVGIRLEMYNSALELFQNNIFFGVGLGNFSKYTNYNIMYPHNVPFEILSELGGVGFLFFLFFYIKMLIKSKNAYIKVFSLYFLIVCLFSGDLSYLRYSVLFMLLSYSIKYSKVK